MNIPVLSSLMIWPQQPGLSIALWIVGIVMAMYVARTPAHRAIRSATRVMVSGLRLSARSLMGARDALAVRNRQVLLAAGQQAMEQQIEREFDRVGTVVARDLSTYPALHRRLSDQIARIDEDYRAATDVPPNLPGWSDSLKVAGELVDKAPANVAGDTLKAMQSSLTHAHSEALSAYREEGRKRHEILSRMTPFWRTLSGTLGDVDKTIHGLSERAQEIDRCVDRYSELQRGTDRTQRTLSSSSLTQFFISGLVLVIALLGGFVNFQLIALPMSEMVGGGSHLGSLRTSDVAALVIIMVEVAMGLFLMESIGITRMFPVIHSLDDRMRRRMTWVTFTILFTLASVEASLAYMRDLLALDHEALTQSLAGLPSAEPAFRWIPSMGQMVMGFILPFALTFVAIPLESFIHASRTVAGAGLSGMLHGLAWASRVLGQGIHHLGSLLIGVYDLIICVPLRIEMATSTGGGGQSHGKANPTPKDVTPHRV